jgi:hypothetical protein
MTLGGAKAQTVSFAMTDGSALASLVFDGLREAGSIWTAFKFSLPPPLPSSLSQHRCMEEIAQHISKPPFWRHPGGVTQPVKFMTED